MIVKLTGVIDSVDEDFLVLDVNGVGYQVFASNKLLTSLAIGSQAVLYTQMIIREDAHSIYGFLQQDERSLFNTLITVQGVGAKVALNIMNHFKVHDLISSVLALDVSAFKKVSGIGPKLAERIVNELKSSKSLLNISANFVPTVTLTTNDELGKVVSALTNLGFQKKDAFIVANDVVNNFPDLHFDDAFKKALQNITQGSR